MKTVISGKDIEEVVKTEKKVLEIEHTAIVTPFAEDIAKNNGIQIVRKAEKNESENIAELTMQVMQVLRHMGINQQHGEWIEETSPNGLRLIKGNSTYHKILNMGSGTASSYGTELCLDKSGAKLCFLCIEDGEIQHINQQNETMCVISGDIYFEDQQKKYHAFTGDVVYIPANSNINWIVSGRVTLIIISFS